MQTRAARLYRASQARALAIVMATIKMTGYCTIIFLNTETLYRTRPTNLRPRFGKNNKSIYEQNVKSMTLQEFINMFLEHSWSLKLEI